MKRITIILTVLTLALTSCSGVKKTQKAIDNGDYDSAFNNAVEKLNKDKNKFEKQVPLLKNAFNKANTRDLADITRLKKQNPTNLQAIYKKYMNLDVRQDEVILLEPLYFEGKQVNFNITDYSKDITKAKKNYADELYGKAIPLMNNSKDNSRKAFAILEDLQYIDPNYRSDLSSLIASTKKRGSNFVFVKLHNNVANQLKVPLKEESQKISQDKEIQTGWNYQKDSKGNVMKDKDGNDIKKPIIGKVHADVFIYKQSKATTLQGKLIMKNLKTGTSSNPTPMLGEAKLENIYGTYKGEPKAIDEKYYKALKNKKQDFPSDVKFNEFALQTFKLKVEQYLANLKY